MGEVTPLARVCSLLNKHHVRYLVIGGYACILHGLVRTTEDVDILVEDNEENFRRIIAALSEMEDGVARELTPQDFAQNVVVKIADEVEVDVSRVAWRVSFADAIGSALSTEIDSVVIPYLDLETLIASKNTYRDQDRADVAFLTRLMENRDRAGRQSMERDGRNRSERVPLGSSAIEAVTYDETKRTLIVEFKDGDSYLYSSVPKAVYRALLKAESAGGFWNEVKDEFDHTKLD